jgi:hypothetical protein
MNKWLLRFTLGFTALILAMASTGGTASTGLLASTPLVAQENCTTSACDVPLVDDSALPKATPSTQPAEAPACETDEPKKCKVEGELEYEDGCLTGTVTCKGKGITITIEINTCEDDDDEGGN